MILLVKTKKKGVKLFLSGSKVEILQIWLYTKALLFIARFFAAEKANHIEIWFIHFPPAKSRWI